MRFCLLYVVLRLHFPFFFLLSSGFLGALNQEIREKEKNWLAVCSPLPSPQGLYPIYNRNLRFSPDSSYDLTGKFDTLSMT